MSIKTIHQEVLSQKTTVTARVRQALQIIERHRDLNAFTRVFAEEALQQARELDHKIEAKQPVGRLAGILIAVKDNINIKGHTTTCASNILHNFVAPFDATVIERLKKEDAIFIGKTNMDEFAMGSSSENSAFGPVKNPIDPQRVPGGSSGGSAVAVAIGACDVALGSETGGSIRQPASFTGIVGLKPTYGRVSRYGLVAYASSLDQIGAFARNARDLAYLLSFMAGVDAKDSTSADVPVPDYSTLLERPIQGLKIGLPQEYFARGLDPEIKQRIFALVEQLKSRGAQVQSVNLPMTKYAIATYYIIATAEASSNLARYDGVRYGYRSERAQNLNEMYQYTRSEGFGEEVKRRILLGTYVLSAGYYDAYYKKAMQVRRLIREEMEQALDNFDVLITPTTPTTAFKIGEKIDDPLTMYLMDIYTVTANLAGICAINVPAGTHSNGLPFGLQILSGAFKEEILFQLTQHIMDLQSASGRID